MKNKNLLLVIVIVLCCYIITGCKKDEAGYDDFVNGFSPELISPAGTSYNGDYFPIKEYYKWQWSGLSKTKGEMKISASGQNETEPIDETENVSAYISVQPKQTIKIGSTMQEVYPTTETDNLKRYFKKSTDGLYVVGIKPSGSTDIVEVKNPMYIKNPLISGDSWESQPSISENDYQKLISGDGMNLQVTSSTMNCKLFVLGSENIAYKNVQTESIKVQERATADLTIKGTSGSTTINMTMLVELDSKLNLIKDVGIAKSVSVSTMSIKISYKDGSESGSISLKATVNEDLSLYSFTTTASSSYKSETVDKNYGLNADSKILQKAEIQKSILAGIDIAKKMKLLFY